MGGQQNYGSVRLDPPDDPPFHEEWERRAFAMALLSMRMSGTNLDAFRHALNRQHPIDYLAYGYYGRWLKMAENLLVDSSIIAPGAVDARARRLRGEDVEEPPPTEPDKPDYAADRRRLAAPGRRSAEVRRGRPGAGARRAPDRPHPAGRLRPGPHGCRCVSCNRRTCCRTPMPTSSVRTRSTSTTSPSSRSELWGADSEPFTLGIDLYESYLEAAP